MSLSPFSTGRGAAVCKGWQSAQSSPRRCLSFLDAELRVHYVGPIPHIQNSSCLHLGYSKNVYIVQKLRRSHNQQGKNHDKTMTIHTYIWVLCNHNKDQSQNISSLYIKKRLSKADVLPFHPLLTHKLSDVLIHKRICCLVHQFYKSARF
jgi:hypothetical protein